jgi:hypothetical protein
MALAAICLGIASTARAQADFAKLLAHYGQAGARDFSADRGRDFWQKKRPVEGGQALSCSTCHGSEAELRQSGRHFKSGKVIDPMAPSVNKDRYTDMEKLEKWFTRNCKQVVKRECGAQEKGDVLRYLSQF